MFQDTIDAKIGSFAPGFSPAGHRRREIALSDFRGRANVVLFFIREYT